MPFKVITIVIEFLGINMFLALPRAHFNTRYARAKMILSRAKNIFLPAHVNSIVTLNNILLQGDSMYLEALKSGLIVPDPG